MTNSKWICQHGITPTQQTVPLPLENCWVYNVFAVWSMFWPSQPKWCCGSNSKQKQTQKISLGQSAEVQAVEKCRNWALYLYKREDRITEFHRIQKAKGLSGGVPKPDSHAKWGSCTTMLRNVCDTFGVWEHFQLTDGECPPALTTDELILVQGIANCVEIVWASVCKLQNNSALLADYAPITKVLRDELAARSGVPMMYMSSQYDRMSKSGYSWAMVWSMGWRARQKAREPATHPWRLPTVDWMLCVGWFGSAKRTWDGLP